MEAESKIRELTGRLEAVRQQSRAAQEEMHGRMMDLEDGWREKLRQQEEKLKGQTDSQTASLESELRRRVEAGEREHAAYREMADRTIEAKDKAIEGKEKEIARLSAEAARLQEALIAAQSGAAAGGAGAGGGGGGAGGVGGEGIGAVNAAGGEDGLKLAGLGAAGMDGAASPRKPALISPHSRMSDPGFGKSGASGLPLSLEGMGLADNPAEKAAIAEQHILFLARQQAQREEEVAQCRRHIQALQEEITDLQRENQLRAKQESVLKEELRNMERAQKRETVDMTYLKNVILQLLIRTDQRATLIPVIGMILQFSPDELKQCRGSS
ncbi:unnamed protein product [Closterium sp. NIES-54]